MKQRIFKCNWIRPELAGIHLVDKCLILFMTILLIQSACTLLGFPGNTAQANEIDVIIRTSSAAIFGYFLSANFIRNGASGSGQQETARMGRRRTEGAECGRRFHGKGACCGGRGRE
ncbi:MAG: hypothetical protein ACLTOJ_09110 [[Clostridium] symbiosum]